MIQTNATELKRIQSILKKSITGKERVEVDKIDNLVKSMVRLLHAFCGNVEVPKGIFHTIKHGDDNPNKGQFGYYCNESPGTLYTLMQRLDKTRLLDLGSGLGLVLYVIDKISNHSIKVTGYEIEDLLIKIGNSLFLRTFGESIKIHKKDILKLTKKDLEDHEVIYFWEPFASEELQNLFAKNLINNMYPGQIIACKANQNWFNCKELKKLDSIEFRHSVYIRI